MPHFTVYNETTGEIRCGGTMATEEWCLAQANAGEAVYLGQAPAGTYIQSGAPVALPARPSEHHTFDWVAHAWSDPRTLGEHKAHLKALVAERRWLVETGGLTLASGVRIKTGREDRAAFAGALAEMEAAGLASIDFKAETGFVELTPADMRGIASEVTIHVQSSFSTERTHIDAIDALTEIAAAMTYDSDAGWPP